MTTEYFETTRRREAELAAARQAIADGEASVPRANAAVDEQRELLAVGKGSRGAILKAQRAHGREIERLEQARAALRAVEKRCAAEQEEADRQARREAAQRAAEARAAFDAVERRIGPWVDRVIGELATFDAELARLARDTQVTRLPSGTAPHRELTLALHRMKGVYPNRP